GPVDALQAREILDVLACGEPLVQAARIRQHAELAAHRQRIDRGVDAVHQHLAAIGFHQRIEHAQRGGLAGAVGAEQAGDLAVAGGEADAVDGFHCAEGLVQIPDFDHGCSPRLKQAPRRVPSTENATSKGSRTCVMTCGASSTAAATKAAASSMAAAGTWGLLMAWLH